MRRTKTLWLSSPGLNRQRIHSRAQRKTLKPLHACVRACMHAYVRACVHDYLANRALTQPRKSCVRHESRTSCTERRGDYGHTNPLCGHAPGLGRCRRQHLDEIGKLSKCARRIILQRSLFRSRTPAAAYETRHACDIIRQPSTYSTLASTNSGWCCTACAPQDWKVSIVLLSRCRARPDQAQRVLLPSYSGGRAYLRIRIGARR